MSLERRFRELAIHGPHRWPEYCLQAGLLPLSWCYAGMMGVRRWAYEQGVLRRRRLPVPVLAVGNLVAGGTGKTPVTEWLLRWCLDRGVKAAVVSRGYGGKRDVEPLVVSAGGGPLVPPGQAGDEPWMLARRHPSAIVVVGADRYQAGMVAVRDCGADLVLLDDAFQHLKLWRDNNIVLLDADAPFANGCTFPAGYLRESPNVLNRADLVLLTRADQGSGKLLLERVPCVRVGYRLAEKVVGLDGVTMPIGQLRKKKAVAFCGIADPEGFFRGLCRTGLEVVATRAFPDHYGYPAGSIEVLNRLASDADVLLTTEKDAVKLSANSFDRPCYYLPLELDFLDGVAPLERLLNDLVNKTRKSMNLSEDLLDILACPQCKQSVRVDEDKEEIVCDACRLAYPVRDDIPVMLVDEARSF